ncbi:hypothetical protein CO176_01425 [Candidatus Woesebacteria bacterium CG_4_9_14_3_um_filter_39_10]|uniref:DUF5666 domain-containing protein n=2 Tax=Candidatus Woeseibacteriota TaxID=1752722 RepID=A0A2M7X9G8_9BACT|nr:MAG: hypothetical protein CO176_01425 [Candidatus Woesebacteria bacterium CG_4_9_14_3_um_filter_39_10]
MRKEVWLAVIGGITLGLIIGFGVYRINFAFKKGGPAQTSPTPTPNNQAGLTIAKPNYDDVITSLPQTISGIASKDSRIVISTNSNDYITKTDQKGTFEKEVDLEGGVNQIIVSAVTKDNNISSQELRLIYSTQLETQKSESQTTSGESGVREIVLKKVEDILNSPKAYLGTVTDIAEKTIQLKTDSGAIEQVSAEDLPAGKAGVKLTDIAIGDYIIAMGYRNGNHVLNAKRILITQPTPVPQIKIIYGKVKSISKKEIMVNENDKAAVATTTKLSNKKTKAEDTVIVVGTTIKDIFTARTIFLVESTVPSPTPKI